MYRKYQKIPQTSLKVNQQYVGETIEQKINRVVNNKEPIKDGAPLTYTERKDGVQPAYNVRTDKWEIATEAMDVVNKTAKAKSDKKAGLGKEAKDNMDKESKTETTVNKGETGGQPTQGTDNK